MSKFVVLLALASPAFAADYSLDRIEGAANALRHISDSGRASCGISSDEALRLTQPLKALRDAKIAELRKSLQRDKKTLAAVKSCEQRCLCGAYSDLLEGLVGWSKEAGIAALKASKTDRKKIAKCAKPEVLWLCKSPLLGELRADAPPAP